LTADIRLDAELGLILRPGWETQRGGIGGQKAQAAPTGFGHQSFKGQQKPLVERLEDGSLELLAGLGERAFAHGADWGAGEGGKQLVEARLQTALEGAQEKGDENGKGEDALAGEGGGQARCAAMKSGSRRICARLGKNGGRNPLNGAHVIVLLFQYVTRKLCRGPLNLTALGQGETLPTHQQVPAKRRLILPRFSLSSVSFLDWKGLDAYTHPI
jgi:hypothetical protein